MARFLSDIVETRGRSPRDSGLTMVIDRLSHSIDGFLDLLGSYADVVKIGWGLPFLLDEKYLVERISSLTERQVPVSNGGTLLELSISKGKQKVALERLRGAGFNTIELSEGVIEVPQHVKKEVAEYVHSHNLRFHFEVGRKNPRNQLSLDETVARIEQSWDLEPDLVIIEGRESGRGVGIFDENGGIKWDWVERLTELEKHDEMMFEAPQELQQTELIIHNGSDVNLGNVSIGSLGALQSQRDGLRGDTFGATAGSKEIEGGPAVKFVHYVITSHGAIDQSRIMSLTGLNRRTVQESLRKLIGSGIIKESSSLSDLRKRIYSS